MKKIWSNVYFNIFLLLVLLLFFSVLFVNIKNFNLNFSHSFKVSPSPTPIAEVKINPESNQEKFLRLTKDLEAEKVQPTIKPDFYQLLTTYDIERNNFAVCGYEKKELIDYLLLKVGDKDEGSGFIIDSGVWSNNCESLVFSVDSRAHYVEVDHYPQVGVWVYYPQNKATFQLIKYKEGQMPPVYRFISSNLVAVGDNIIDIRTRKVVDQLNHGLILLRDKQSPWTMEFPSNWTYQLTDEKNNASESASPQFSTIIFRKGKAMIAVSELDLTTGLTLKLDSTQDKQWQIYSEYSAEGHYETYYLNEHNPELPKSIIINDRSQIFNALEPIMNSIKPFDN